MNKCRTQITCALTGCKYNSACCDMTNGETYCTREKVEFVVDNETGIIDCKQYAYDYNKPCMCITCQLEQYGEIDITPQPMFEEVDNLDDLF